MVLVLVPSKQQLQTNKQNPDPNMQIRKWRSHGYIYYIYIRYRREILGIGGAIYSSVLKK